METCSSLELPDTIDVSNSDVLDGEVGQNNVTCAKGNKSVEELSPCKSKTLIACICSGCKACIHVNPMNRASIRQNRLSGGCVNKKGHMQYTLDRWTQLSPGDAKFCLELTHDAELTTTTSSSDDNLDWRRCWTCFWPQMISTHEELELDDTVEEQW
eukprot:2791691-Amphidinium_carterae.1